MDADRIALFTGPYNLHDGVVPVVDGVPRWPWDEVVARRRLGEVAKLAGLRLTGDEVFIESGPNDTWFLSGETVLQVCYRGTSAGSSSTPAPRRSLTRQPQARETGEYARAPPAAQTADRNRRIPAARACTGFGVPAGSLCMVRTQIRLRCLACR